MKKVYEQPKFSVIEVEDVIMASGAPELTYGENFGDWGDFEGGANG
jgi:hypothetical protein